MAKREWDMCAASKQPVPLHMCSLLAGKHWVTCTTRVGPQTLASNISCIWLIGCSVVGPIRMTPVPKRDPFQKGFGPQVVTGTPRLAMCTVPGRKISNTPNQGRSPP